MVQIMNVGFIETKTTLEAANDIISYLSATVDEIVRNTISYSIVLEVSPLEQPVC